MAAALPLSPIEAVSSQPTGVRLASPPKSQKLPEFAGVFRGRELTRKERRLACGIAPLDSLIGGGIVRGRRFRELRLRGAVPPSHDFH